MIYIAVIEMHLCVHIHSSFQTCYTSLFRDTLLLLQRKIQHWLNIKTLAL